jgi:hypothetical protein
VICKLNVILNAAFIVNFLVYNSLLPPQFFSYRVVQKDRIVLHSVVPVEIRSQRHARNAILYFGTSSISNSGTVDHASPRVCYCTSRLINLSLQFNKGFVDSLMSNVMVRILIETQSFAG